MTVTTIRQPSTVRAYARVSVFSESSQQIAQAKHLIGKWAAFKYPDADVVWYVDEAVSGAKPMAKRPAGAKLLRELQRGDVFAVTKIDRAARNVRDLLDTLERVEGIGASFAATEQEIDTSGPYGRFTLVLLAAVAELERGIMAERQADAREQLRRDRRHVGRVHFGFEAVQSPDHDKRHLVVRPHPVDGPKLRAAVDAVLAGASIASQARALEMPPATLQKILRSPRLIGRVPVAVKVTVVGEDGTEREKVVGWRADPDIPADPDAALIPVVAWNQLQAKLERDEPRSWTLTDGYGLALACSVCEGRMYLDVNSGAHGGYRCHAHKGAPTIARREADTYVSDWFLARYGVAAVMAAVQEDDTAERQERLAVVSLALRETTDAMLRPGADVPALARRVTELHAERAGIEAEPVRSEYRLVPTGRTVAERWSDAIDADRVTMLRTRVVFVVHPRGRASRIEPVSVDDDRDRWEELTRALPDPFSSAAARQGGSVSLTMPLTRELHEDVRS